MRASSHPVQPVRKEFLALAKEHTLVPVCRTLTADLETPVSAFLRAAWAARECFLLESVEGGEQVGRYTFIGLAPFKPGFPACLHSRPVRWAILLTMRYARSSGCLSWPKTSWASPMLACCSSMKCWPSTMCARRSGWLSRPM